MAPSSSGFRILAIILGLAASWVGRLEAATISGFSPAQGPAGTEVVVSGTALQNAIAVYFGTTDAPGEILSRSANSVRARVPPNGLTGQISVFSSGSSAASSAQIFVCAPRVETFLPLTGSPGTLVTISGANFGTGLPGGRGAVTNVLFNGARAAFQVVALNQLVTVVPTNATTGPITLANDAGAVSTLLSFQVASLISGFAPPKAMPGDSVEVTGQNFVGALKVELGLVPAPFTVPTPSNLVFQIPTNAINGRLQITTPAGTTTTPSNVVVLPRIIRFSPESAVIGATVVLDGGGFHGITAVRFNGVNATFAYRSSTHVDALVPANASSGPIQLVTTNGTFITATDFNFPARITTVTPGSGDRGDLVTVEGANLGGATAVLLNGVPVEFTIVSGTRLTFPVPPLATTGQVTVHTPAGPVTSASTFTVRAVLDGFTPANGPLGTPVNLLGAGLTNLSWVRLGGVDATFTVLNSTNVRAVVPVGAYSGPFRLRTAGGQELESAANFFVDGAKPTVSSFTPANGMPGTKVTLQGQGLRSTAKVQFNGADGAFKVNSSTQIEATVPANATTGLIAVTTLDGIALTALSFVVGQSEVSLTIEVGPGTVNLRWPQAATGFSLETSLRIGAEAAWQAVAQTPVADGTDWRVTLVLPQTGNRFFRLRQ